MQAPLFRHGTASAILRQAAKPGGGPLLILADAPDCPLAALVGDAAGRLGWPQVLVVVPEAAPGGPAVMAAGLYLASGLRRMGRPALAIDVAVDPRLEAVKEILEVAGVAVLRLFLGSPGPAPDDGAPSPDDPGGLVASVLRLADVLSGWPEPWAGLLGRRRLASRGGDAGWAAIRAEIGAGGPVA